MAGRPKGTKPYDGRTEGRFSTGAGGGPRDYTGRESDMDDDAPPPPNLDHVRLDWGGSTRKARLTPENVHTMALMVAAGTPIPTACTAIGCGKNWNAWNLQARRDERAGIEAGWDEDQSPQLAWLQAMEQAKAAFEVAMVARVGAAAPNDWKAAAWLLERRAAQRWYPRAKLELHANGEKRADISVMSTEKLIKIAQGLIPDTSDIKILQPSNDLGHNGSQREVVDAEIEEG